MNNLKSIEEFQGIISQAIEELDLPLEPSELYNPIRYLLRYSLLTSVISYSPRAEGSIDLAIETTSLS